MDTTTALIEAAREAGVTLRPRLWVEPLDRLGPELRDALRRREGEVIRLLIAPGAPPESVSDPDTDAAAERATEPALPAPGTPERDRLDALHRATVSGYQWAALRRPPSWADPDALPSAGCRCSCCNGSSWWCEVAEPRNGWRCSTCHPAPRSWAAGAAREVRT